MTMTTTAAPQCMDEVQSSEHEGMESAATTMSENLSEFMSLPDSWGLPDVYLAPSEFDLDDLDPVSDMPTSSASFREQIAVRCLNDFGEFLCWTMHGLDEKLCI